jgi:transcriptional regulator with XRE-family HTH domain
LLEIIENVRVTMARLILSMSRPIQSIYLRTLRLRWALSQHELGLLVGVSGNAISKYEVQARRPRRNTMLALEIVFGVPHSDLFPALREKIEEVIMRRAAKLDAKIRNRDDANSLRKLGLLNELNSRLSARAYTYEPEE